MGKALMSDLRQVKLFGEEGEKVKRRLFIFGNMR